LKLQIFTISGRRIAMNNKEQLIQELEQASDYLVEEVLNFLLFTKNRKQSLSLQDSKNMEMQLKEMADDLEIQAENKVVNEEFLTTEMDGLT
jgi:hypothetical protein